MEVIQLRKYRISLCLRRCIAVLLFMIASFNSKAQVLQYHIKDGKMVIALGKNVAIPALDSFINVYGLQDLDLITFINTNNPDSLKKLGWIIDNTNQHVTVMSKPFMSFDIENVTKIDYSGIDDLSINFSPVSSTIKFGYNRFKNKTAFVDNDGMVTFFLKGNLNAKQVILSGSFVEWAPDKIYMTKKDSGWIATVKLEPGKYWYKFIIDGNWDIDQDNQLSENDGMGNMNSVFYKTNVVFKLEGSTNAKKVYLTGSFNNWNEKQLLMNKTATGWELPMYLADGTHTYRYIVDRKWIYDEANPDRLPNEFNDYNSVIRLGKAHLFQLQGYTNAKKVMLTGSFNGWRKDELQMNKTATGWELPYTLGTGNHEYKFVVDGKEIKDPTNTSGGENSYLIINPNFTFRLKGYENAKHIFLAGDFNGWSPATYAMQKIGDEWTFTVNLSPGKHLYKFVVDGEWIIDPGNKLWEQNQHGTGNSVIWIEK